MEPNRMKICLKAIGILSVPQLEELTDTVETLDQVLENNIRLAAQVLDGHDEGNRPNVLKPFGSDQCHAQDARWRYCCCCLEVIVELADLMDADSANCNASGQEVGLLMSVQQEKELGKCIQLTVAMGLLPNVLPNIGIPIHKRTRWPKLHSNPSNIHFEQKYSRLTLVVRALCHLEKSKLFGPKFVAKHLTDLLAALLQLCHAPISKPTSSAESALWLRMQEERQQQFVPLLESVVDRTYPPLLVKSLLLLQGPPASHARIIRDAPPPAPRWIIRACAHLLTKQVTKPNGIIMTIQGVMDVEEITSDMWERCDQLAYILSTPPSRDGAAQREYYRVIGPQLQDLVQRSNTGRPIGALTKIACSCYRDIAARHRQTAEEGVFRPLFQPLYSNDEDDQIRCIETLHTIFVSGSDPSNFLNLLDQHARRLIELYRGWCQGVLQVKTLLEELLIRLIRHGDGPDRIGLLRSLLTVQSAGENDEDFLEEDEGNVSALLSLLQRVNDVKLSYAMFVSLLEDLPQLLVVQPVSSSIGPEDPHLLQSVRRGLVTLKLIGVLSEDERLQSYLLDRPKEAVDFAHKFLKRAASNLQRRQRYDLDLEKEGLVIVFAVIALQIENLAGREGKADVWALFDPLLESLELLASKHSLERIRGGADDLRVAIQTRGFAFEKRAASGHSGDAFQTAWDQLSDPLLPVQGHAILSLSGLLKRRDPEALKNKDKLLNVFLGSLEHEDAYIYLMAVQALASLADVYTEEVVHALVRQLELNGESEAANGPKLVTEVDEDANAAAYRPVHHRPPEVRLKVGEALLQVVRLIGPLIPKFKRVLLDSFLRGTKDSDPFVRASCLHNLGELCGLLGYSLGSVAQELLSCVTHLVRSDPEVEVRRAAVLLITLLLRGLDTKALQVLEPIIKNIYRVLKDIVLRDDDDRIMTFHANQALEKLAEIVKLFLTTPQLAGKVEIQNLRLS